MKNAAPTWDIWASKYERLGARGKTTRETEEGGGGGGGGGGAEAHPAAEVTLRLPNETKQYRSNIIGNNLWMHHYLL